MAFENLAAFPFRPEDTFYMSSFFIFPFSHSLPSSWFIDVGSSFASPFFIAHIHI